MVLSNNEEINISLNKYQIANLRALIETCGYGRNKRVERNPFWCANTGDWIGEIYNKLPDVDYPPNKTPEELIKDLRNRSW